MSFIIAYITNPNNETAEKIVSHLVENRIIACGNIFPIKSIYWWKGKVEKENEVVAIVKTTNEKWELLKEEVKKMHPYDVPCIVKIDAEANEEYEKWIEEETQNKKQ